MVRNAQSNWTERVRNHAKAVELLISDRPKKPGAAL